MSRKHLRILTQGRAFYAMHFFLADYFRITSSDSIGALLSCMLFLNDGKTADPVLWEDWCEIVGDHPITIMQAFLGMNTFLHRYFQGTTSVNVKNMFYNISLVIDDKPNKEEVWRQWVMCVEKAFKD